MPLALASYREQAARWPQSGRHILAQYDDTSVVVYQAFGPPIGRYAATHGRLGGHFQLTRMSWIKPNFLWMMYRSSWGKVEGQEVVLALRLRRTFFDSLLAQAVPSTFNQELFESKEAWRHALEQSDVRLQWDPDHTPTGAPCQRRAIQLGLRGRALDDYGTRAMVEVIDMTDFVASQREHAPAWQEGKLLTPEERVYVPTDAAAARRVGISIQNS